MPSIMALIGVMALMVVGTLLIQESNGARLGFLFLVFGLSFSVVFPYIYNYLRYFERDHKTHLEIDLEEGFILYTNARERILFHKTQIQGCEISMGILVPMRLQYVRLKVAGKGEICISNLIVDPFKLVAQLELPYLLKKRLFNPIP